MAELATLARLRERLVVSGLLSRASDLLYSEGRAAALAMAAHSTRPRVERTQVLRLGALAEQTASVSVVLDYVQVQTGKRAEWRQEDFGPRMLRALGDLQGRAESLAAQAREQGASGDDLPRSLHLELARRFIRHFIAAYVAGPPGQAQPQRAGEIARPSTAGHLRGPAPDRRQPPGTQAAQARRPVGARPPRPEQPSTPAPEVPGPVPEVPGPVPSTPMQEAISAEGGGLRAPGAPTLEPEASDQTAVARPNAPDGREMPVTSPEVEATQAAPWIVPPDPAYDSGEPRPASERAPAEGEPTAGHAEGAFGAVSPAPPHEREVGPRPASGQTATLDHAPVTSGPEAAQGERAIGAGSDGTPPFDAEDHTGDERH